MRPSSSSSGSFVLIDRALQGRSPIEQFQIIHSRQNLCSNTTKALLLTTYFKWLNLFPEIHEQLVGVFEKYSHVLDAELQQRACEYLAIARMPNEDLLQVVVDEMPPYPERESAVRLPHPLHPISYAHTSCPRSF